MYYYYYLIVFIITVFYLLINKKKQTKTKAKINTKLSEEPLITVGFDIYGNKDTRYIIFDLGPIDLKFRSYYTNRVMALGFFDNKLKVYANTKNSEVIINGHYYYPDKIFNDEDIKNGMLV